MKRIATSAVSAVLFGGILLQASGQTTGTSAALTGTWTVTRVNSSEPLQLVLTADGSTVKGTFGGSAVVGEFKDGRVTFADATSWTAWRDGTIGSETGSMYPVLNAGMLKDDGTLSGWSDVFIRGYGPQAIKRLPWTATRSGRR